MSLTVEHAGLHWEVTSGPSRVVTSVRQCSCGQCWARPGIPCTLRSQPEGDHMARYDRAFRRGLITPDEMAAVEHQAGVFRNSTIVLGEAG